jgi:hypothetical protein
MPIVVNKLGIDQFSFLIKLIISEIFTAAFAWVNFQ